MRQGSLCYIKSKKNALNPYMVIYSDIDEVLTQRNKNNAWLPSMTTEANIKSLLPTKQNICMKSTNERFVLLEEIEDNNGSFYYRCLYNDRCGWLIGNKKNYTIIEEEK